MIEFNIATFRIFHIAPRLLAFFISCHYLPFSFPASNPNKANLQFNNTCIDVKQVISCMKRVEFNDTCIVVKQDFCFWKVFISALEQVCSLTALPWLSSTCIEVQQSMTYVQPVNINLNYARYCSNWHVSMCLKRIKNSLSYSLYFLIFSTTGSSSQH